MVKSAAVHSAEGVGRHCKVPRCRAPYVQQRMYPLSFPNFKNSSAATRLFYGASAGCSDGFCRRCRVPLQSTDVQGAVCATIDCASAVCCRANCRRCSENSALSHLQTVDHKPRRSALFASHMRWFCSLSQCHSWPSIRQFKICREYFFTLGSLVECMYGSVW